MHEQSQRPIGPVLGRPSYLNVRAMMGNNFRIPWVALIIGNLFTPSYNETKDYESGKVHTGAPQADFVHLKELCLQQVEDETHAYDHRSKAKLECKT